MSLELEEAIKNRKVSILEMIFYTYIGFWILIYFYILPILFRPWKEKFPLQNCALK